ncbi:MAG TPA: M3 family oligoendopeptidase, partial [Rhabdochlamydiaceae bacterium]|nr:M3 family oligoendopeptidase [Rhabdochlamydiaceae bacterium]
DLLSIHASEDSFQKQIQKIERSLAHIQFTAVLKPAILTFQELGKELKEADSYVACLCAQNTADGQARQHQANLSKLKAAYQNLTLILGEKLKSLDEVAFKTMLYDPDLKEIAFHLKELRKLSKQKLDVQKEKIINDLSAYGYHGFWDLYCHFVGKMRISIGGKEYSAGQVENMLNHEDRKIRVDSFKQWVEAWSKESDFLAQILNHMAGFRLKVYEERGWNDLLFEPLNDCRMDKKTLEMMWEVIQKNKPIFLRYLKKKAELLRMEKLAWVDLNAPLNSSPISQVSYDDAKMLLLRHFENYSPRFSGFTQKAFDRKWVEAEDRAGKTMGGFCSPFPKTKESRIFMTYGGSAYSLATLAHELGHAYHFERLHNLPFFQQNCGMNVAETASTFAEMVFIDGAIKEAKDKAEKLSLLDDKLRRAIQFFMNIHARYLFELNFYEERKMGFVSAQRLSQLMEEAQKKAYLESLSDYFPQFWASKLHFYYTEVPFYNFPYTFGFLFSLGLYVFGKKEGSAFMDTYDRILEDTARMSVEELAQKHLGVDLSQPQFWQEAIDDLKQDVEEFLAISS